MAWTRPGGAAAGKLAVGGNGCRGNRGKKMAAADDEKIALVVIDAQYDFMPGGSLVCMTMYHG